MMIGEMLGYAPQDWEKVRYWSEQTMLVGGQTNPNGPPHFTSDVMSLVIMDWADVTMKLIAERQARPANDLIFRVDPAGLGSRTRDERGHSRARRGR